MSTTAPSDEADAVKAPTRATAIYASSGDGLKAVRDDFHYWTAKLTDSSFELSLALIAANWAAFGSIQQIRINAWARWSLALIIASLLLSVLGAKWMSELHSRRVRYASADPARWDKDCAAALGTVDPWPFTRGIERLGRVLRECKTWLPVIAGAMLLVALLSA